MTDRQFETIPKLGSRWEPHTPLWQRILWIGIALLLVGLLIWLIWPSSNTTRKNRFGGPVPVGVAQAQTGDVRILLDALGAVTPLATVAVHPEVTGYLTRFDVAEGQMVREGQLLAEIDPRPFQASLDQAKGQLARDQAALQKDKTDLQRYQNLWKANAVSQQVLQDQVGTVGTDEGTVTADKAAVETARINLGFTKITSPVAGRVGLRQVDPGNLVVSGGSSNIIVVTELQPISVVFSVPEDNIGEIMQHVNAGEKLAVAAYDRAMTTVLANGTLSNVDNQIDNTTGMVKMRAMFDNPDRSLFPQQFVNARILVDTLHNQTYVPAAAIQHGAQGTYIYVIDKEMTAEMRTVTTGPTDGDKVAVTSGVTPGETVVVDGIDRLKDGAQVTIPNAKNSSARFGASTSDTSQPGANSKWKHNGGHRHHHRPAGSDQGASP